MRWQRDLERNCENFLVICCTSRREIAARFTILLQVLIWHQFLPGDQYFCYLHQYDQPTGNSLIHIEVNKSMGPWLECVVKSPQDLLEMPSSHCHDATWHMCLMAPLRLLPPLDRPMAARTARGWTTSTSSATLTTAPSTLKTSAPSSASCATPTLSSRVPSTTGCPTSTPTVSWCRAGPLLCDAS